MKTKLFTLLFALLVTFGISNAAITVRLDPQSCSAWSTVHLWAWTASGNVFNISWPGPVVHPDDDGWYSCTFDESISLVNIIWNDGTNKTVDINNITESTCYALNSTSGTSISVSLVTCPSSEPEDRTKCGDNLHWSYNTSSRVLTITGSGAMEEFSFWGTGTSAPWENYRSSIRSVYLPNGLTSIGRYAFYRCTSLTSITIPNRVTSIGESAFECCSGLISITIPNSVTNIGYSAFEGCSGLTSITIPNSVTSIGKQAFVRCTGLASVTLNSNAIVSEDYMASYSIEASYTLKDLFGTQVKEYIIGDGVTRIGNMAFLYCSSLISITIPNSVTCIGESAFYDCSGLSSITCEAVNPPSLGSNVFSGVNKSIPLYVPSSSVAAYQAADQWKDFTNIQAIGIEGIDQITNIELPTKNKVLRNGQIFILRGGKVYTLEGQEVK